MPMILVIFLLQMILLILQIRFFINAKKANTNVLSNIQILESVKSDIESIRASIKNPELGSIKEKQNEIIATVSIIQAALEDASYINLERNMDMIENRLDVIETKLDIVENELDSQSSAMFGI